MAVAFFGGAAGPPRTDHGGLELSGHGDVNGRLRLNRHQARLRPQGAARRQHGRAMIAGAAGNDGGMTKGRLVAFHRAARRPGGEIFRQGPIEFARQRTRNQADVRRDFQTAHPLRGLEQAALGRADREGEIGPDGGPLHLAVVGVQAGGNIHGQNRQAGLIDPVNESFPGSVQRTVQANAKQAVNNPLGPGASGGGQNSAGEFPGGGPGINRLDQRHLAPGQVAAGGAGVVAVVAAAGQDEEGVAGLGEIEGAAGEEAADVLNDSGGGAARGPVGVLPLAHLGDRNDRNRHERV